MKIKETEMIRASKDKDVWNTMTTNAWTRHGTLKKKIGYIIHNYIGLNILAILNKNTKQGFPIYLTLYKFQIINV